MSASDFCFSVGVREMKILLTNDDSIQAKGLAVLWSELKEIAEVVVGCSGSGAKRNRTWYYDGHTLARGKSYLFDGKAWAVNGTPADCVKLAVNCLLEEEPDLVIAGINRGSNLWSLISFTPGLFPGHWKGLSLGFLLSRFQ